MNSRPFCNNAAFSRLLVHLNTLARKTLTTLDFDYICDVEASAPQKPDVDFLKVKSTDNCMDVLTRFFDKKNHEDRIKVFYTLYGRSQKDEPS